MNQLFYGDNLEVLRNKVKDGTVDLCYIDPPFNSKRNYNQIYNNIGGEDRAQAQAFVDTWTWDDRASAGFSDILGNEGKRFTAQTIELIKGLHNVLKKGSLLAYLIHITLRVTEIRRVLKSTGSFYLHCDPTASHYLKLVLDAIFCSSGGEFRNEIIWHYLKWSIAQSQFVQNHDVVLFYSKSFDKRRVFNTLFVERSPATKKRFGNAKIISSHNANGARNPSESAGESDGVAMDDVWDISRVPPIKQLYPTEKPRVLLERIIRSSTNKGDVVLDAYCGCGTTIVEAETLQRQWIGVDITYQSISVVLMRLEDSFDSKAVIENIVFDGIPSDMESARALANKKDDRLRKEFEKWAVLTYTNNRAIIHEKKGADAGIDGIAYTQTSATDNAKLVLQVKSGGVQRGDIAKLRGDMEREKAEMATLITLEPSTAPMRKEAKAAGQYQHPLMQKAYDRIQIVTVQEILEENRRMDLPLNLEVLRKAQAAALGDQEDLKL